RHLNAKDELEPAEPLNISGMYVGSTRVGRDIRIIVKEDGQPPSEPVKQAADVALKELHHVTQVGNRKWSDHGCMRSRGHSAFEILESFCGRAASHTGPSLDRRQAARD